MESYPGTAPARSGKLRRLRRNLEGLGLEGIIISHLANLRYLFDFTGSTGTALVTPGQSFLFLDSRYTLQGRAETSGCVIEMAHPSLEEALAQKVRSLSLRSLAVEEHYVSLHRYRLLTNKLPRTMNLKPVSGLVEELRMVKSIEEIEEIQRTLDLTVQAFESIIPAVRPGIREIDLAAELEYQLRKRGARKTSFDTIVASGWRSAMPHGVASTKTLAQNEFVVFDFGAYRAGYASDMTRTVFLGKPESEQRKIYATVLDAVLRAEEKIRPGLSCQAVDRLARSHIEERGFGDYFGHGTGHGIGLEVHEAPRIAPAQKRRIRRNMVFTIEPGIYLPDKGGVRIEDVVRVSQSGCEVMTRYPKEFVVL
jgi:Xaa-Pro aminopeptidase